MPAIGRKDILSCTAIRPIKTDKAITTIDIAITTIDIAITITIEIGLTTRIEAFGVGAFLVSAFHVANLLSQNLVLIVD